MSVCLHSIFGNEPVSTAKINHALQGYRAPRSHITVLVRRGELIPLRRDLYLCRREGELYSEYVIAHYLVPGSYISYEAALSYHNIIPERVRLIKSACTGRSRRFSNTTGRYAFIQQPAEYQSVGWCAYAMPDALVYQMASPEKALCDLILDTPRLRLQSARAARGYLLEYLRADPDELAQLDFERFLACATAAHKKKADLLHTLSFLSHEYT